MYRQFNNDVLEHIGPSSGSDRLPACYRGPHGIHVPGKNMEEFLVQEFSLSRLEVLKHLWYAGAERPAKPLHEQIMIGREIVITERMDLHLLWTNDRKLFMKPLPGFLLESVFWRTYLCCQPGCECETPIREAKDSNNNLSRAKVIRQSDINQNSSSPKENTPPPKEFPKKKTWKFAIPKNYE